MVSTPATIDEKGKTDKISAFGYNSAGALTKDESRGITPIEYDNLGHPVSVVFDKWNSTSLNIMIYSIELISIVMMFSIMRMLIVHIWIWQIGFSIQ